MDFGKILSLTLPPTLAERSVNLFAADILFLAPYVETASAAFYPEVSQGFIGVFKQKESAREKMIFSPRGD